MCNLSSTCLVSGFVVGCLQSSISPWTAFPGIPKGMTGFQQLLEGRFLASSTGLALQLLCRIVGHRRETYFIPILNDGWKLLDSAYLKRGRHSEFALHIRCSAKKVPAMPVSSLLAHTSPLLVPNSALRYHREPTYLEALAEQKDKGSCWEHSSTSSGLTSQSPRWQVASAPICPDLQEEPPPLVPLARG